MNCCKPKLNKAVKVEFFLVQTCEQESVSSSFCDCDYSTQEITECVSKYSSEWTCDEPSSTSQAWLVTCSPDNGCGKR